LNNLPYDALIMSTSIRITDASTSGDIAKSKKSKKRKAEGDGDGDGDEDGNAEKKRRKQERGSQVVEGKTKNGVEVEVPAKKKHKRDKKEKKEKETDVEEESDKRSKKDKKDKKKLKHKGENKDGENASKASEEVLEEENNAALSPVIDGVNGENKPNGTDTGHERSVNQKKKKDKRYKTDKEKHKSAESRAPESVVTNGLEEDEEMPDAPAPAIATDHIQAINGDESTLNEFGVNIGPIDGILGDFLSSDNPSCFYSTRISLHLSIPAISLSTGLNSIMAFHLGPLLLTYFPPVNGIVIGYSDPVLSSTKPSKISSPRSAPSTSSQNEPPHKSHQILAKAADDFGVAWVWLTVTFLVFAPRKGDDLRVWSNVASAGYVGCLSYNVFQVNLGKDRIPEGWSWQGPAREPQKRRKKGRLRDEGTNGDDGEIVKNDDETRREHERADFSFIADGAGNFVNTEGEKMPDSFDVKVADTDMIPERGGWTLQIDASMLDEEAEEALLAQEKETWELRQRGGKKEGAEMSGAMGEGESILEDED
jgi:DNA-directed RNA polymerase I subunit RPA43